jgi:hypothetical protein
LGQWDEIKKEEDREVEKDMVKNSYLLLSPCYVMCLIIVI